MPALPKFEDWRRPWKDGELDEEIVAKLVYNLKLSEEKLEDKVKTLNTSNATLQSDLDAAKSDLAAKGDGSGKADESETVLALRAQVRELEKGKGKIDPATQAKINRLEVAIETGLSLANSRRLVGETREELEADAKVLAKDLGLDSGDGEQEEEQAPPPSQRGLRSGSAFRTGGEDLGGRQVYETDPSKVVLPSLY